MVCQDIWIIINPYYGVVRRRPRNNVWWHQKWWGPFPRDYYLGTLSSLAVIAPLWWQNWSVLKEWGIMYGVFVAGIVVTLILVEIFRGDIER